MINIKTLKSSTQARAILFVLSFIFLSCSSNDNVQDSKYAYKDVVRIFAVTEYINSIKNKESHIIGYNLNNGENQVKYRDSLYSYISTKEKWHNFLKDTIEYYILFRKKDVSSYYYKENAYNKKLDFFDSSYIIDTKKEKLPNIYWKIGYTKGRFIKKQKTHRRLLFSKEHSGDSFIREKIYYDESKQVIKKEQFTGSGTKGETTYYYRRNKIVTNLPERL